MNENAIHTADVNAFDREVFTREMTNAELADYLRTMADAFACGVIPACDVTIAVHCKPEPAEN